MGQLADHHELDPASTGMTELQGRNALVTGGGTGIGFGCADELAAAGATVTIAGRRGDVLDAAVERLRSSHNGADIDAVPCDITEEDQVADAVTTAARGGNLDVLVANAGSGAPGAILQMGPEEWDFSFRLNVIGSALCIKHAGLVMKEHGGGSIITISSTSGTKVQPWLASYVVSKAGLDMLVRCAAIELSPHRIRVNSIQPGYVTTESMAVAASDALDATLRKATPLGSPGTPADIGRAVRFLAGPGGAWITGQVFGVDGGLNVPVMPSMAPIAERLYGEETIRDYGLPDFTALGGES
jgi:NAD(P)-dependent dehydrogenase (short-subunit alcohol dehydrogenase family)